MTKCGSCGRQVDATGGCRNPLCWHYNSIVAEDEAPARRQAEAQLDQIVQHKPDTLRHLLARRRYMRVYMLRRRAAERAAYQMSVGRAPG